MIEDKGPKQKKHETKNMPVLFINDEYLVVGESYTVKYIKTEEFWNLLDNKKANFHIKFFSEQVFDQTKKRKGMNMLDSLKSALRNDV